MANSFLQYLDGREPITQPAVIESLRGVPFLRHQFDWFLQEVAKKPVSEAVRFLAGYTGVRKMTPARETRASEIVRALGASS